MNFIIKYRRNNLQSRRGMILLVVMAVLSFFAVLGMTFILMTGKNRDSAETAQLAAQNSKTAGNSPQELLEEGIMQVLVGPPDGNTESALYGCDLIGDMYNAVDGDVPETLENVTFSANKMAISGVSDLSAYAGKVVTIADGPYKGQSTIILNSRGTIIPFASGIGSSNDYAVSNVKCVINNNRAYQGGEANYDAADINSDANYFMSLRYTGGDENNKVGRVVMPSYYRGESTRPGFDTDPLGGTSVYQALTSNSIKNAANKDNPSPWDIDNDGDGDNDSVWMNLGLPPRPMPDGTLVVPLYAILVEDMDGRLNVNAHSMDNLSDPATAATTAYSYLNTTSTVANPNLANNENLNSSTMLNGQGFGPAEVNLDALLGANITTEIVEKRTDGAANTNFFKYRFPFGTDAESAGSILDADFNPATHYKTFRTPLDFYGVMAGAIDQNGMFVWQKRGTVGKYGKSSYERDLGSAQPKGTRITNAPSKPFSPEELERVLRAYDDDSQKLESRLFNIVKGADNIDAVRNLITTESWDMPYCDISGIDTSSLPEEIQAGFKMDINRPLTSYEDNAEQADSERTQLAKDLYYLITTVYPGVDSKVAAQWAVNAVDFRDADSVCTHLQIGNIDVWGCERPELLITETFAFHARMTEDSELGGWRSDEKDKCARPSTAPAVTYIDAEWYDKADCPNSDNPTEDEVKAFCDKYKDLIFDKNKMPALVDLIKRVRNSNSDGIADMDQIYKPETGLFIELYNPWLPTETQEATPTGEYKNGGVVLGSDTNNKLQDCAWRIAVAGGKAGGNDGTSWAEDLREKKYPIDRVLYFGAHAAENGSYTYKANVTAIVKPGQVAVIGPAGSTIFARYEDDGAPGREINIPLGVSNTINIDRKKIDNICSIGVVEEPKYRFSLTDIGGYSDPFDPATGKLATPRDMPYDADDAKRWTDLDGCDHKGLGDDFEQAGYRIVYLQRLANPYKAYNAATNPYITFDQMPVDLFCYNGRQNKFADYKNTLNKGQKASETDEMTHKIVDNIKSRQRGETQAFAGTSCVKFWSAEKIPGTTESTVYKKYLSLCTSGSGRNGLFPTVKKQFYHSFSQFEPRFYNRKLVQTTINTGTATATLDRPSYESVAPYYFPNRPFNSVMELMLVPQVSAYELTSSVNAIDKPVSAELSSGNLPKYLYPENGIDFLTGDGAKLLNYVRVQTPFVVTPMNVNTYYVNGNNETVHESAAANGYRWTFREPGKININSITHPAVWAALLGVDSETEAKSIDGFACPATADTDMYDEYWGKIFTDNNPGTRPRTFGSSSANYIAANYPIFKMNNTAQQCQSAANSIYFQTQLMQRLSNLTTTRSNVFAVWVTVGFFESNGTSIGKEYGLDNGSRQRYRAFYLIDRTRPVGYSPGKRMNADKTIILRRYLP